MIEVFRYRIPFVRPFEMAGQSLNEREGIVLRFQDGDVDIYSEIAPLPGFSPESLDDAIDSLKHVLGEATTHIVSDTSTNIWNQWLQDASLPASVRFGLDTMYHQQRAARSKVVLQRYLNPDASDIVGCNAVVGILPAADLESRTVELVHSGYKTIKFKVQDPSDYLSTWKAIRSQFPDLSMRFDANGSWSPDVGLIWAKLLEAVNPEYLEQPYPPSMDQDMARLQQDVEYPIAYDESSRDLLSVKSILETAQRPVIILKPMLLGSVTEIAEIITMIRERGAKFTITTLIESGIGRRLTAMLTAAYGNPGTDHGLGTGLLFSEDVVPDLPTPAGSFSIESGIPKAGTVDLNVNMKLLTKLELY